MRSALIMVWLALLASPVSAQSLERVHSDLPLFSGRHETLEPKGFTDVDGFGCSGRVALGDWRFVESPEQDAEPNVEWLRLENYGVFHCAIVERWADGRAELGKVGFKHSWFVQLGETNGREGRIELWTLQSGSRPGSDYLLLARRPSSGIIKSFEVLQTDCPSENVRKGDGPDIWRADYCAINSARELRMLARRMAKRPAVGILIFVAPLPSDTE